MKRDLLLSTFALTAWILAVVAAASERPLLALALALFALPFMGWLIARVTR